MRFYKNYSLWVTQKGKTIFYREFLQEDIALKTALSYKERGYEVILQERIAYLQGDNSPYRVKEMESRGAVFVAPSHKDCCGHPAGGALRDIAVGSFYCS